MKAAVAANSNTSASSLTARQHAIIDWAIDAPYEFTSDEGYKKELLVGKKAVDVCEQRGMIGEENVYMLAYYNALPGMEGSTASWEPKDK